MSVAEVECIDVDALIPDGIEPIEEWRTWNFDGKLRSHNGTVWTPGEPLAAACTRSSGYEWEIVPRGWSLHEAAQFATSHNSSQFMYLSFSRPSQPTTFVRVPTVEPPEGFGYFAKAITHDNAPHADCSCGIYSGKAASDCPAGTVLGKVKLWGTIVPGDKGSRAQYGYPSEFHVGSDLIDNQALKAFGVPIILSDSPKVANPMVSGFSGVTYTGGITFDPPRKSKDRLRRLMWFSTAFNLSAAAFNILSASGHL